MTPSPDALVVRVAADGRRIDVLDHLGRSPRGTPGFATETLFANDPSYAVACGAVAKARAAVEALPSDAHRVDRLRAAMGAAAAWVAWCGRAVLLDARGWKLTAEIAACESSIRQRESWGKRADYLHNERHAHSLSLAAVRAQWDALDALAAASGLARGREPTPGTFLLLDADGRPR